MHVRKWVKTLGIAALVAAALSVIFAVQVTTAASNTTQLEINISITCGLTVNSSSLSFGNLTTGETSAAKGIRLTNVGSATAALTINGTKFYKNDNASVYFSSNYTHWNTTSAALYEESSGINELATSMGFSLANNASQDVFFRIMIPLGQAAGQYNQTVVVISTC